MGLMHFTNLLDDKASYPIGIHVDFVCSTRGIGEWVKLCKAFSFGSLVFCIGYILSSQQDCITNKKDKIKRTITEAIQEYGRVAKCITIKDTVIDNGVSFEVKLEWQ
jgi:hypothetical protein